MYVRGWLDKNYKQLTWVKANLQLFALINILALFMGCTGAPPVKSVQPTSTLPSPII